MHNFCPDILHRDANAVLLQNFVSNDRTDLTMSDGKQIIYHGLCTDRECCSWLLEVICSTQAHTTQTYQNE